MKLVPPKKVRIFNYNSFSAALLLETKGLEVIFNEEYFNFESLFELESILTWCATHTEVKSILFTSKGNSFIKGFDYEKIKDFEIEKITKFYSKLHNIIQSLIYLPQTIVVDLKNGATNEGLTFAMAADIRIANSEATFQFSELEHGLINASGLFSILNARLNQNVLRSLILSGTTFGINELNQMGSFTFQDKNYEEVLKNISKQSSIARVQTKCAMIGLDDNIKKSKEFVEKLLNAALVTSDYKREKEFLNLRDLKDQITRESESSAREASTV